MSITPQTLATLFDSVERTHLSPYKRVLREEQLWRSLCHMIDRLDGAQLHKAIHFACSAIDVIRDEVRCAPKHWCVKLMRGEDEPRAVLARSISLMRSGVGDAQARVLFSRKELSSIRILRIDDDTLSNDALCGLAHESAFTQLEQLYLGRCKLGDEGLIALANSVHIKHIHTLSLDTNHIGDQGVVALAECAHTSALRELYLSINTVGNMGAKAIAHAKNFGNLKRCALCDNVGIDDQGAMTLLRRLPEHFPNLTMLDLGGCSINPTLVQQIERICHMRRGVTPRNNLP